jgi:hypothetical protein
VPGARFEVADALALDTLVELTFDTAIDSGLFHVFDDALRSAYVTSLRSVLRSGGYYHLMCFSDRQPGDWGPRRIHQHEIIAAFRDGWAIEDITVDAFELNPGTGNTNRPDLARHDPSVVTSSRYPRARRSDRSSHHGSFDATPNHREPIDAFVHRTSLHASSPSAKRPLQILRSSDMIADRRHASRTTITCAHLRRSAR